MGSCYDDEWLDDFDGVTCHYNIEAKASVEDAISFLNTQSSLPALKWSQGVALATGDHVGDVD